MFNDLKKCLARKCPYKNFILQPLIQSAQHFYEKRDGSCSGSVPRTRTGPDADLGEAQKHTDPTDPDPEHWRNCIIGRRLF
jgi:hypothetical protein